MARADRTLFHPKTHTLFLSDLHLGKGLFPTIWRSCARRWEFHDLDRLLDAIDNANDTVWILGDLFHHPRSITHNQMDCWINTLRGEQTTLKVIPEVITIEAFICRKLGFSIYPGPQLA